MPFAYRHLLTFPQQTTPGHFVDPDVVVISIQSTLYSLLKVFSMNIHFFSLNLEPSVPREAECCQISGAGCAAAAFVMMESQLGSNSPGEETAASAGPFAVQQSCVPNFPFDCVQNFYGINMFTGFPA